MGNFFQETAAKIAGNVTQSVVSAIIVFLITTYVLVDIGKKEQPAKPPAIDSSKKEIVAPLLQNSPPGPKSGTASRRVSGGDALKTASPTLRGQPPGSREAGQQTSRESLLQGARTETLRKDSARPAAGAPSPGGALLKNAEEAALKSSARPDRTVVEGRPKGDTLQGRKATDDVKKVKQRAEDVFDELDQEAEKKAPQ